MSILLPDSLLQICPGQLRPFTTTAADESEDVACVLGLVETSPLVLTLIS